MSKFNQLYRLLGLPDYATIKEIRSAKRRLTRELHPDRARDPAQAAANEERLKDINAAAAVLETNAEALAERRSHAARQTHESRRGRLGFQRFQPMHPRPTRPTSTTTMARQPSFLLSETFPTLPAAGSPPSRDVRAPKRDEPGLAAGLTVLGLSGLAAWGVAKLFTMSTRDENGAYHDYASGQFTGGRFKRSPRRS